MELPILPLFLDGALANSMIDFGPSLGLELKMADSALKPSYLYTIMLLQIGNGLPRQSGNDPFIKNLQFFFYNPQREIQTRFFESHKIQTLTIDLRPRSVGDAYTYHQSQIGINGIGLIRNPETHAVEARFMERMVKKFRWLCFGLFIDIIFLPDSEEDSVKQLKMFGSNAMV
ncbi:hypothetical protein QQP08_020961 [Theobroma cacao]|nr:hypothetical protein QQP08_020961 [Theobroma cacao]